MPGAWGTDNRRSRAYVAGNGRSGADTGRSAGTPSFAASGPPGVASSHKDAFAAVLASLLAQPVTVQLTDGAAYSGTLTGVAPGDKELSLVLHFARLLQPAEAVAALGMPPIGGAPTPGGDTPSRRPSSATVTTDLLIPGHKLAMVAVDAAAVEDGEAARGGADGTAAGAAADGGGGRFATDTGISGRMGGAGGGGGDRQLTRFDDFGPTAPVGVGGDLGDGGLGSGGGAGGGAGGRKWDQFAENERKFGVRTSYDEHDYTTKLDKRRPGYHERELKAARVRHRGSVTGAWRWLVAWLWNTRGLCWAGRGR